MPKYIKVTSNTIKNIFKYDFPGMAAEMAFNFILGLFPFLIFLIAIFGLLGTHSTINQITSSISIIAPNEIVTLIKTILTDIIQNPSKQFLSMGFIGIVWITSNITTVITKGLNKAYKIQETRNFWHIRSLSILMIIMISIVLFISINLMIFGTIILKYLSMFMHIPNNILLTLFLVRWPITFLTLFVMAFLIYYFLPDIKIKNKALIISSIPGTLFFCSFWIIASWLFSLYLENFNRYNEIYGAIATVIILLVWLYYTSLIMLIGGEINSEFYKHAKKVLK